MLLKFPYYAQEHENAILHGSSLHIAENFIQTVLLECINETISILCYTMTVLLEYINRSL